MNYAAILTPAMRALAFGIAVGGAALPARAQSFKTAFDSGYDGWVADFSDYVEADSTKRRMQQALEPISNVRDFKTALRMTGQPSYRTRPQSDGDLFPFIRKRITGLTPNTEYKITFHLVLASGMGQFSRDSPWIKAGATAVEPRKIPGELNSFRMNLSKGPARGPGMHMDTLGCIGYEGQGHRMPEAVSMDNEKHPFRAKTDATGAVWIIIGGEYLPSGGADGMEFNVGRIQIDLVGGASGLQPRKRIVWEDGTGGRTGLFRWGNRAWTLAGERR